MKKEEWIEILKNQCKNLNMSINENQLEQLHMYMKLLQKCNESINLTSIIEDKDILQKHFIDST